MENTQFDLLPESLIAGNRDGIIPAWIRIFSFLFLVLGAFALLGLIFGVFGYTFSIALYGLETNQPLSVVGLCLIAVFIYKGIVAYALLKKSDAAIRLALIDGFAGVAVCIFVMSIPLLYPEYDPGVFFRLELLALIPYLLKLKKIKSQWEGAIQE